MTQCAVLGELYQVLLRVMEDSAAAIERKDAVALETCARDCERLVPQMEHLFREATEEGSYDVDREPWLDLQRLLLDAQASVERNRLGIMGWTTEMKEALQTLSKGRAAVKGYAGYGKPVSEKVLSARA